MVEGVRECDASDDAAKSAPVRGAPAKENGKRKYAMCTVGFSRFDRQLPPLAGCADRIETIPSEDSRAQEVWKLRRMSQVR